MQWQDRAPTLDAAARLRRRVRVAEFVVRAAISLFLDLPLPFELGLIVADLLDRRSLSRRSTFSPITLSPIYLISLISDFFIYLFFVVVVWVVAFWWFLCCVVVGFMWIVVDFLWVVMDFLI